MLPLPRLVWDIGYSGRSSISSFSKAFSSADSRTVSSEKSSCQKSNAPSGQSSSSTSFAFARSAIFCGTRTVPPPYFSGSMRSASFLPLWSPLHCEVRALSVLRKFPCFALMVHPSMLHPSFQTFNASSRSLTTLFGNLFRQPFRPLLSS